MNSLQKRLSCILALVLTIGLIPGFAGNSFPVRAETVQENFCDLTLGMEGDGLTWQLLTVNGQEQRQSVPGGGKIENLLHAGDQVVFQIENPDQIPYINVRAHKPGILQIGTLKYSEGFADVLSYNETDHIYTLVMPDGNCVVDATAVHVEASSRAQVQVDLTESEQKGSTYTRVYPSLHVEVQTKGADRLTQISYTEDGTNWKTSHDFVKDSEGRAILELSGFRSPVYENYFSFGEIRVDNICLTVRADLSEKTITTVTNEAELREFAQAVNDGDAYQSVTVTLGDDIELTEPWTEPIGKDVDHSFAGTFDGNGHQISGLDIDYTFTEENASDHQTQNRKYFGLFGNLSGSVIKNLNVAGTIDIDSTAIDWRYNNSGGYSYIGGITAYARNTEFKNCVSEVNITAHSGYVGGIAGYTYEKDAAFTDCMNYGDLTITKRNQSVAGITGWTATSLLRCGNYGTITIDDLQYYAINKPPASSSGGEGTLVQYDTAFGYGAGLAMGACTIRQCCNKGSITGKASVMGGLMSYPLLSSVNSATIEDSYNTGSIDMTIDHKGISGSYVYTAGLVGKTHPSNSLEIKNSYNAGTVSSKAVTYGTTGLLYALYHDDGADSSNVPTLDNCYTAASDPSVTAALLNGGERSVWKEDDDQSNGGKPLLYWEKGASSDETYTVTLDTGEVEAKVQVFRDEAGTDPVEAAEDGTYRLPAGTYYYTAEAEGYFPLKNNFTVVKKDLIVPVTLQKYAEVTLKVKPEAADLTLTDAGGKKMEPSSSSEGVYQFRLNEDTSYSYSVSADGYSSVSRQFLAEPGVEITVELEKSDYGANDQFIYGDGNEGKVHVVTRGGTYSIGEGATGVMTIDTTEPVTLVGKGLSDAALYGDLFIDCRKAGTKLTLQDVGISETTNTANLINFTGKDNVLTVEGVCLLDYDYGYTEKHDALIHVPQDGSLIINGAGTLYQYNQTQGAGIGGDTGEMNGEIIFAMTGSAFIKGTKQGAVIGAGANAKSSGEAPGSITFESGTYNLETNSRGAAIGGSAGSGGASSGTEVYVRGGSININCDYTGSAVGGGGYVSGNDASGGTVYITGGSLRTYIDKNAASNENGGFNNAAFTEGVNDAVITAQRKNGDGENVYKCVFDTSELGEGPYTVRVDGKEYYSGGRHAWAYVNEALSKDEGAQVNVSRTQDNWIPNDEPNLYFYLTGQDHTITVGDQTYQAVFDTSVLDAEGHITDNKVYTEGAFTVKETGSQQETEEYSVYFGTPSLEKAEIGQEFTVPLILKGNLDLAGAELSLSCNSEVAKIEEISFSDGLTEKMNTVNPDGSFAKLTFYGSRLTAESSPWTVASVMMKAVAEGTSKLAVKEGATAAREGMTVGYPVSVDSKGMEVEVVKPQYPVTLPSSAGHGQLEADRNQAEEGETVKLTPVAEKGYELEELTVRDQDGNEVDLNDNGDGSFCFTMPDGPVTVEVSFRESEPDDHDASCPSKAFSDLDTGKWYHEAIDYVLLKNYFNGVGDRKFAPDGTMTRAMFVTVLGRAAGVEEDKNAHSSFSDVADGKWYTTYVDWAAKNGIVNGYDSKTFGTDDFVTREQMAAILYRYAKYRKVDTSGADTAKFNEFKDKDTVSDWAVDAMIWAAGCSLINGMGDGTLAPQETATRAQVAQLLMNFDQKLA